MKKIFSIISILFLMTKGSMAIDTLRLCQPPSINDRNFNITFFNSICHSSGLATLNNRGTFAGDTFSNTGKYFPSGTEGVFNMYCGGLSNPIDTSIYVIIAGRPKICFITSDAAHPVIYVDSASLFGHSSFSLKRQVNTLTWQTVKTFLASDTLAITDTSVNSASQPFNYKIEANDIVCNDTIITTLHLQSNGSNLSWNAGGGLNLRGYYIFKSNGGNFILIDSTANLTYTDVNYQSGDEYYVGAYKDDGCQSNSWRSVASPILVRSNKLRIGTSGISETKQTLKKYYVEGSTLYVELKKADDVSLYDITGRELIHRHTNNLDLQLQPGMYILNVGAKGYKVLVP